MKFICPSCKAKYQIADEKVAGRSVRMKCRKCARMIRISEKGAELSDSLHSTTPPPKPVSGLVPPAPRASGPGVPATKSSSSGALPATPPRASTPGAPAPRPSAPRVGAAGASTPLAPAGRGGLPTASTRTSTPGRPPPRPTGSSPRNAPLGLRSNAAQATAPQPKSPVLAPAKPVAVQARQPSPVAPQAKPTSEIKSVPRTSPREEPQTLVDEKRGLALAASPDSGSVDSVSLESVSPESVSPESALAGAFSAAVTEKPASIDPAAGDEWFVGINGVPVGPIKLLELRSKAAAGAVTSESLVWRDGFEEWKPLGSFPELVAIVEEGTSSARSSLEPFVPPVDSGPMPETVPRAIAVAPAVSTTITTAADEAADLELAGLKPKSGLSLPQIFAMVVAIMFGLTVGFVVFSGTEKTKEVVKYVEVPAKAQQTEAEAKSENESDEKAEEQPEENDPKGPAKGGKAAKSGKVVAASETKQEGLKGLSGLSGLKGPDNGPSGNQATNPSSGKPLDSAAVQGTVRRYTGSVKRSCWQPALDTRDANAPTSARVSVAITVGASGSVQNVSTSGDPRGYRGLATCIARRVRGWQFPASNGSTTVNVPFVFAAQ